MNEFEYYITKYFAEYLPNIKCFSYNTIRSYRDSFNQFLSFLYSETGNKIIKFDNINIEIIHDFINYLSNKKVSVMIFYILEKYIYSLGFFCIKNEKNMQKMEYYKKITFVLQVY